MLATPSANSLDAKVALAEKNNMKDYFFMSESIKK